MTPYILTAIGTIAILTLIIWGYHLYLKHKARGLGYRKGKVVVTQFKPLKELSFKQYICLLPEAPKTATMAMLAELDREGKINLDDSKIERTNGVLDFYESQFVDAIQNEQEALTSLVLRQDDVKILDPIEIIRSDSVIRRSLVDGGLMYETEKSVPLAHPLIFIFAGLFIAIALFRTLTWSHESFDSAGIFILFVALFIVMPIFGWLVRRVQKNFYYLRFYTPEGVQVLDYYEGLKRYIKHVEAERLNYFQNKHESDFLELTPYLILFGMEGPWTKKLKKYRFIFNATTPKMHQKWF